MSVDDIIEKYKRCMQEQTHKMSELKRTMQDYDRNLRDVGEQHRAKPPRRKAAAETEVVLKGGETRRQEAARLETGREDGLRDELKAAKEKISDLTKENARLQEQLKGVRYEVRTLRRSQTTPSQSTVSEPGGLVKDMQMMTRDLMQLAHLTKSIQAGTDVDVRYLLGGDQYETYPEDVSELLHAMRTHMNEVRSGMSDLYAEHCGSKCVSQ